MATNAALNNTRILVVDDEPDLRTLYELTLLREGFRVDAAGSLKEALQLLGERRFDVVITDMRLPDGLGLEVLTSTPAEMHTRQMNLVTTFTASMKAAGYTPE